jgi:hydrogenase nickel incorporation protein HypB
MCKECGCGLPSEDPVRIGTHHRDHEHTRSHTHGHHTYDHGHGEGHGHKHDDEHQHDHGSGHESLEHLQSHSHRHLPNYEMGGQADPPHSSRRTLDVREAILAKNDRLAERNRGFFHARGLLVLNILSSPGSGKTSFLHETVGALKSQLKAGIIVGDLATDNDAQRLRESGAPVAQITTGTMCHLEAEMVARAVKQMKIAGLDLLLIENVGNLVCPASYDLGEDLRIVLVSVPEGEDKPLKYPPIFQAADVVIISKIDLAQACGFARDTLHANLRSVAPGATIFEVSAKTGQGMDGWCEYLLKERQAINSRDPLAV